MARLRSKFKAE